MPINSTSSGDPFLETVALERTATILDLIKPGRRKLTTAITLANSVRTEMARDPEIIWRNTQSGTGLGKATLE